MATILVTDDDPDVRFLLSRILRSAEFDVVEAQNGPDAITHLATHNLPDLAILDVQMPEMDGWQTLAAIRGDERTACLPVVFCTVKSTPDNVAHGWQLGADGYLTKPFRTDAVVEEVQAVLARSDDEREDVRREGLLELTRAGFSAGDE